jgi:uncharacterized peroxidase-related enzyme
MQNQAARNNKPLINPQVPAGEEGRVAAVFGAIEQHIGFVPDGLRLYSFSPPLLENFVANVSYFNSGERLSPSFMAMLRYLVSSEAGCQFCVDMNEGFLTNMGVDLDQVRAAKGNHELAPIADRERPLLNIALKSVNDPEAVGQADVDAARASGWTDRDIFDAVAQAASNRAFNYVLRTFNVEHQGAFS